MHLVDGLPNPSARAQQPEQTDVGGPMDLLCRWREGHRSAGGAIVPGPLAAALSHGGSSGEGATGVGGDGAQKKMTQRRLGVFEREPVDIWRASSDHGCRWPSISAMPQSTFRTILITYVFMLLALGYFAFIRFPGRSTLAPPEYVKAIGLDPELKKDLLEDVKSARDRDRKLVELSGQSFNIVLGATLGFLSAVGAGKLSVYSANKSKQNRDTSDAAIPGDDPDREQPDQQ